MRPLAQIRSELEAFALVPDAQAAAHCLLASAEDVLAHWIIARGETPTVEEKEGFRLLALHRQAARGVPSFNACRETCREIAYHYNLLCGDPRHELVPRRERMMALLATHLALFVAGKMQVEGLGEFCCASRPLRAENTHQ